MLFSQSVVHYTAPAVQFTLKHTSKDVEAHEPTLREELESLLRYYADEYDVSYEAMANTVKQESNWGEYLEGDGGNACGVVHINKNYFPEEFKNCYDHEYSVEFLARKFSEGKSYLWTGCSCMSTARLKNKDLPRSDAKDLKVNTIAPKVGDIVKFNFNGVYHVAYIEDIRGTKMDIWQGNKIPCKINRETVSVDDPRIVGYWSDEPRQDLEPVILYSKTIYMQ